MRLDPILLRCIASWFHNVSVFFYIEFMGGNDPRHCQLRLQGHGWQDLYRDIKHCFIVIDPRVANLYLSPTCMVGKVYVVTIKHCYIKIYIIL